MAEVFVFVLIILPALLFWMRGSSYLVDYAVFVFVFNREIRRLVEYYTQHFSSLSLISLSPLFVLGLLFASFWRNFQSLHRSPQRIFLLMLAAIGYGMAIGIWRNGSASIYQGVQYLSTIGLMGYTAASPVSDKTADRWLRTAGLAAVLAALYGWYQYLTIPAWDAFWVKSVGFVGYMGQLEPTKMFVFSTFGDRGVCSIYLALVAIPMLVSRRWRVAFGWPEVILLLSCIFLTFARSGIIAVLVGALLYPVLNRGRNMGRIVIIAALVVVVLTVFADRIPGVQRITTRFASLLHMQDDSSLQGRLTVARVIWPAVLQVPAGYGIGSSGLAVRLNGTQQESAIIDNGWYELMVSLGMPGFLLFAAALVLIWHYYAQLDRLGVRDDYLSLARTFLVAAVIFTWVNNYFLDFTVMWIAIGRALSPRMLVKVDPEMGEWVESHAAPATS
jgi:hypothetical protein